MSEPEDSTIPNNAPAGLAGNFFLGFGYMGVMSLLQTASGQRIAALWRPLKPSNTA